MMGKGDGEIKIKFIDSGKHLDTSVSKHGFVSHNANG